jgi:hypothetical protein
MKKIILAALALVGLLAIPSQAEAGCGILGLRANRVRALRLNVAVPHRQNVFAVVNNHHHAAAAVVVSNDLIVRRSFLALPLRSYTEVEQVVVGGYSSGYGSATADLAYELRRDREERERLRLEQRLPVASKCDEQINALRAELAALKQELRK